MKLDVERSPRSRPTVGGRVAELEHGDLGAGRRGVHDRLAAAARQDPVREARPVAQAARQDRLLDRRARAARDPRRARDRRRRSRRWRELSKLKCTYLDALPELIDPETGRLHTTFNQTGDRPPAGCRAPTRTSRTSRSGRELGREIRELLRRRGGRPADLGRLLAGRAADPRPRRRRARAEGDLRARRGRARRDRRRGPEARSASEIGPGERSRAKAVNFGIVYGLSAHGLAEQLQIPHEEAAEYIERYLARFPAVQAFIEQTIAEASEAGYVTTLFGRRREIPELRSRKYQTRSLGERLAVNTVIQGTAADIIKIAMVALRRARCATRAWRRGSCSRSTTSCCSRAPRPRSSRPREIVKRGDGIAHSSSTRRWRSTSASGDELARGEVMDNRTLAAALATAVVGGLIALQAPINSGLGKAIGHFPGGRRSRSSSGRSLLRRRSCS